MPIVGLVEASAPLEQGDVLKGITVFETAGGDPAGDNPEYVLVISRPCNAIRDGHVVVAPIASRDLGSNGIKEADTLARIRSFFEGVRDGRHAPDRFYLGALGTDEKKRYF